MSAKRHHTTLPARGQDPDKEDSLESDTILIEDETLRAGFTQIPNRVLRAPNISRDAKILYAFLLSYAWQQRSCFPGYDQLCADMGASPSIVRKYMRELEQRGLLVQKRRGLGKTNLYILRSLSTATLEPPATHRVAETAHQECRSAVSNDQDAPLPNALESNPCSGKEDSREKDTLEEGFVSKGTAPRVQSTGSARVQQPTICQPQGTDCRKAPLTPVPLPEYVLPVSPAAPAMAVPVVPNVPLPVPDDQVLVTLLAQFGAEFGDRAARSSLTRVRTLRQRHGLSVEEVTRHLNEAAMLTHACPTVQPAKRMGYLLAVLENILPAPPPAPLPLSSSGQRRWRQPAAPASSAQHGISRYTGDNYGVCAHCLSSPCELDCPTRTHEATEPAAPTTLGAGLPLEIARSSYAFSLEK